ncbi:hypothetical protein SAMN05660964_00868 [Thiothrix caldifontis]|uniref:Uncharacterized protein n=1 Tax=Thiothrix caldifontis TaxID=525918 RepID=A0A1H3YAB9_9GAMM|nr:hypothetical protein [Thiothrix caldifontis]SEA08607.1 hypothetical protein SAMN05660964_00868 [Thiothrix caldifontis]
MDAYAKRLHNPFNGVLQVVANEQMRALSFNGVDWELQFKCITPRGVGYARIGRWERSAGFKPYPLDPSIDPLAVEGAYVAVVTVLETAQMPLPQDDYYEFWLLEDTTRQPLALLASCRQRQEMRQATVHPVWKCISASQLDLDNTPEEARRGLPPLSYRLEQQVKHYAGQNPQAQWFLRAVDGTGQALNANGEIASDVLAASHFPPLLLRETWGKVAENALCTRYLQRIAPRLLTLQALSLESRDRVEQMASRYAQEVAAHFHLYPAVADKQRMTALRVEARLRSACFNERRT